MTALGLIEVDGFLAAIASLDAALKAADVKLLRSDKIRGGLTTIQLSGDVAAIIAAIEAGEKIARQLHRYRSSHVISRLDEEVYTMLRLKEEKIPCKEREIKEESKGNLPLSSKPSPGKGPTSFVLKEAPSVTKKRSKLIKKQDKSSTKKNEPN